MASYPARRPPRGRVTMRDVARLANVSQSTVSRVLNRAQDVIPIGEETQQRVLEAVRKLGYQPNQHARSLRGQRTHLIAMMVADVGNAFYHPMVRAVQDYARRFGCDVMITNSDHARQNELLFCESLVRRPVDGAVLVPYHLTTTEIDRLITRTGVALAAVGQHVSHPQVDVVFADDSRGTYQAVSWLIEARHHRRIGFIGVTEGNPVGTRRHEAFLEATRRAGLEQPPDYFQRGDWSAESGRTAMQILLSLPTLPTAVFACNDLMAIGAMEAAHERGLRIPEDVAVVGFDDIPAASWVHPRLTTVAQHPGEMGTLLAQAIFQRIEGEYSGPGRCFEVPCRLVERESA